VKYCNAACKKKHRSKHKKAREEHIRRAAELHDKQLFKDHPPNEECPICFLPLPIDESESCFASCCGKVICDGCMYAMEDSEEGGDLCAFCRVPGVESDDEQVKRVKKLMDKGNGNAFQHLACYYAQGTCGMSQDWEKARELWLQAGELGCAGAYHNLGVYYDDGHGVDVDKKSTIYYYEIAAMKGDVKSRINLGSVEWKAGNYDRAVLRRSKGRIQGWSSDKR